MDEIFFTVEGKAEPAGSKKALPVLQGKRVKTYFTPNGYELPMVNIVDDNELSKSWKQAVALVAKVNYRGPLLEGPLEVEMHFYRQRPGSHFGAGRNARTVKPSAPEFPTTKPDVLKLARAVEDALTGVIWADDAQIVDEVIRKRYGRPCLQIWIRPVASGIPLFGATPDTPEEKAPY